MIIYDKTGSVLLDIEVNDTSVRYKAIKGDNTLTLKYSLSEHIEVPLGAYCVFKNERYYLMSPENFTMKHRRNFEYDLVMYSEDAKAKKYMFVNPVDGRLKFSLTAKPKEHLQMFVDNMNMRDGEGYWSVGECPDHVEIVLSYNHMFCYNALVQLANELELDYWFEGTTVNVGKLELNKDNPLPLSYGGDGEGLKTDIKRTNYTDALPVEVLYVQGSDKNIDPSKYGASELHLPKGQTIRYDGTHFEDEAGFNASNSRTYVVDGNGYSIRRADKEVANNSEDSFDCTEIYPTKEEIVESVVEVDKEKHFYDILFKSTVDYSKYVIEGEKATIIFQSGMLAGKEFDLATDTNGNLICEQDGEYKRVEIVPQSIDGITMPDPDSRYMPNAGESKDTFKVFNIQLPDEYVSEAEWEMFKYAVKHMYANEDAQYTIAGTLDEIYAKRNWVNIEGRLQLGNYISFSDKSFQAEPLLIRITGIKEFVNKPHSPVLEISNASIGGTLVGTLNRIENQEVVNDERVQESRQYTNRRFRSAQQSLELLQAAFRNFSEGINPVTVRTMAMLVGDESLQFKFTASSNSLTDIACPFSYDETTKQMKSMVSYLKHMTLGIKTITTETMSAPSYKTWHIPAWASAVLDDGAKRYYVYVKASKSDSTSECLLSETPIGMEDVSGYYHFLVGILNSEYDGKRDFITLYGFTEVLPGQITTDVLRSANSNLIIDLLNAKISAKNGATIEGKMTFQSGSSGLENLSEWSGKQTQIDTAVTNASAANSKADNAQSTANSANETAKDAQSTANNAQTSADNAQTMANSAQSAADNALSKVETTKKELEESIQDAEKAANSYTDEGKAALQASIDALNEAKANISEVYTKTEADGVTNSAEQRAKDAAQGYASAAQSAAETNAKAYADGVADDAEKAAIADAESKLAAAKQELEQAITEVEDIANAVDAANKALDTKISDIETGVNESVAEINKRLDGVVENYYEEGAPSLTTKPVTDWIAASEDDDYELINHVGDTYTNIEEYLDDTTTPDAGKSWRWCWCDDSSITDKIEVIDKEGEKRYLHWHPIADSDAVKALLEAAKAKTAADGKSKNFVNEPTPPYKEGDLWIQGPKGDTWRCKDRVNRTSGSYDASDWELASKYTDDTKANEAKDAADNAQETADNAKEIAQNAKLFTDSLNNDSILTEVEKREIRRLMSEITECTGTSVTEHNAKVERSAISGDAWYLVDDKSYAEYYDDDEEADARFSQKEWAGYYSSNMHEHGASTITRLTLTIHKPLSLKVKFGSDAESNYDYLNVGALDVSVNPTGTEHSLTDSTKQASTKGKQGIANVMTKTFAFDGKTSSHFIELSYRKDSSAFGNTDSGYYRLMNESYMGVDGNEYIVEMNGSFHRYYLTLMRNGYTAEATKLKARLDALMSFLNTYGLWTSGNTTSIPATFRASLNDLVAKYYAYAAEVGFDISMNRANDMQYLANAMKNGRTIIDGGLVMSSMVAVADTESASDADVEAFLNGSDFAEDATHGKLILAGGIPESVEVDGVVSTDLENRSEHAKTRIYEDGAIKSKSADIEGTIVAKSGKIGDFNITSGIESEYDSLDEDGYGEQREVSIRPQYVALKYYSKDYSVPEFRGQCDIFPAIGGGLAGSYAFGSIIRSEILDNTNDDDSYPTACYGLIVSAKGAKGLTPNGLYGGNFAIQAESGMFAGLRPQARIITGQSTNFTLSDYDHTIIVNAAGYKISLTLPDSPQEGQRYEIYVCHATTDLWVDSGSVNVYNFIDATDVKGNLHFGSGRRYHIELFFCGQWWLNYRFLY